jgi:dolichol-phosphate mannosyltransferase
MKTVIIVPTFNEHGNIAALISALLDQFKRLQHDLHILVVDDDSPDGTADVVRGLQTDNDKVHLLTGRKAGLGVAYIRGMDHAINVLQADLVFEMDADFSHKPEDIPRLISEIEAGADFVIGSRYVPGGSVPKTWNLVRRLNSMWGNLAARYIAGIPQIRDCTAGFRAIRSSLLRRIDFNDLRVQGYAFQVALLHAAVEQGGKIREIPVNFIDRKKGESKLRFSDILEFAFNVWWIRLQSSRTFIKFAIVGTSGVLVNLGFFTLFLMLEINKYIASPIAIELSIIWNFLLNNYWTFRWRKTSSRTRIRGLKFNLVSILALGLSYGTFVILSIAFPDIMPQIHQLIGIVPATLVNYFLNTYWTFRHTDGLPLRKSGLL